MKIWNGYCALMLSLALYGCGVDPSGTPAAESTVALSSYSASRPAAMADSGDTVSPTIYVNGVPLDAAAVNAALLNMDLAVFSAATAGAPLPQMANASRPSLGRDGIAVAKAPPPLSAFRNVTSVPKGMPTPAF
ncbi:hypothetical protein [Oryzomonas rubra]|uniref:Uncharacterized protein n=1 Tax=Oryzomonas rubra TaxID=2509454 RepID=A0A5A9XMF7_9BACT|nr:hypothetical protein [Oryzomonas rubra]KAA0894114.1 hypothetical protein ET418_03910 [Oryzomonas rubra]